MDTQSPVTLAELAGITGQTLLKQIEQAVQHPLFPHQARLLAEGRILEGASALVCAPTGSGKSLLADLASLPHVAKGRQAIHLVPTRSLARERAEHLDAVFGPMGYRVALSTREDRRDDEEIRAGRVDLVVAVYEKAQALFLTSPLLRRSAGLVVADEVQLVRDSLRGPSAEILLRLWKLQGDSPQILALTSGMEDMEAFATELELPLLVESQRPVPLRVGKIDLSVARGEWSDEATGRRETFDLPASFHNLEDFMEGIGEFAEFFEGPVLAFVPTRRQALSLAEHLAAQRLPRPGKVDLSTPMEADTLLPWLLQRGVGYHSAELTRAQRRAVEDAFRAGEIDWCFSTTTLAEGVNLAARTVLVFSPDGGFPKPIGNLFGRAGRPGTGAGQAFECRFRWDFQGKEPNWIQPTHEDLIAATSQAIAFTLRSCMPPLTREGLARTLGEVSQRVPFKATLEQGLRWGLWSEGSEGLRLLPPGELVARGGVDPCTVCGWRTVLRRFPRGGGQVANLFLAIGSSRAGRSIPLTRDEKLAARWVLDLQRHLEGDGSPLARHFLDYLREPDHLPRTTHEAAKATILALHLLEGEELHEVARLFLVPAGVAEELGHTAGFLLSQLAHLAEIMGAGLEQIPTAPQQEGAPASRIISIKPREVTKSPRLVLKRGATGQVRLGGREVRLTRLQFRLLELLARHPGEGIPYERIERYVWPDASVERQQISFHKSNIEKRLREVAPDSPPLIETHATWGIRLALEPEDVRFEEEPTVTLLEEGDIADFFDFNSIAGEVCL